MFFHTLKYAYITLLKNKESIFWTLIFPIALATFMNIAFGNVYETTEAFKAVKTGVVKQGENKNFVSVLEELSKEGDDRLLDCEYLDKDEAVKKLESGDIAGIIYVDKKVSLTFSENGINQTILKVFLEQYSQSEDVITTIMKDKPEGVEKAAKIISSDMKYYKEESTTDGNQDAMVNYFYAIFAMSCLFASFSGVDRISKIQADSSTLGIRRAVAPVNKKIVIAAEYIATESLHFVIECITLLYMMFVLKIDFGDKIGAVLIILLAGSAVGVALGTLIGAIKKLGTGAKIGVTISVSMGFSIMADLCVNGIRDAIEHTAPIINRINPAALIVDSFYSLSVYDTYDRFIVNVAILIVIAVILCTISFFMIRRNKYASL